MLKRAISNRIIAGLLALMFAISMFVPFKPCDAASDIKVLLDGASLSFDVPPIIENGRTLVPFRKICEALGAEVEWDEETRTVAAFKDNKTILLKVGEDTAYINQTPTKLDTAPIIKNDRTLIPLRFLSEAFGAAVNWDNSLRTVKISTSPEEKPSKYIMGYYYSQSYEDFLKNVDKMSAVAAKWYTLDENGSLINKDTLRYINVPEGYDSVIKTAKENGVEIHMLVFENNATRLNKALSTPESRTALIDQISKMATDEGFDGVNIDFEAVTASGKDQFNEFIKSLYAKLKAQGKSLSLSLPVKTESVDWRPGYDYTTLGKYADFVVLMAYDKSPSVPGPQSGIDWVEEVVNYATARIPAEKIVLGIGCYGYDWVNGKRSSVIAKNNGTTYLEFADDLSEKYNLTMSIDQTSGLLNGKYTDENGQIHEVWMESDYSIDAKAKMVLQKGLKGIAIWRLGYTTPSFWDTLADNFKPVKMN